MIILRKFLCGILALALLITLGSEAFCEEAAYEDYTPEEEKQFASLYNNALDEEAFLKLLSDDDLLKASVGEFSIQITEDELQPFEGLDEDWINILLLGTDSRDAKHLYSRSDTMIIASINRITGQIKMTSLVRDMYVEIHGFKNKNRINTAVVYGGPLLAVRTVNETFHLNIEYYAIINLSGFESIVNVAGGVDMDLSLSEIKAINYVFKISEGDYHFTDDTRVNGDGSEITHLNGSQALAYARIRHTDNNFFRNERQRKLLSAIVQKLLNECTLSDSYLMTAEAVQYLETNLTANQLLSLIQYAFLSGGEPDISLLGLPENGEYHYETINETSVIAFDQEAAIKALHSFIYDE